MTPLYKFLKDNGTTFYAFPGAAEDISAAYQNDNYNMYFSKYILLDIPAQNLINEPTYFDFGSAFNKSSNASSATEFSNEIVESLRNYVANQEVVIRESRLNNSEYYYDTNALETTSEKIFWKWCKKLNIIGFEPAVPSDEYYSNLLEFEKLNNDDEHFPEFLWKEREVIDWQTKYYSQSGDSEFPTNLEIELNGVSNLKVGDIINIYNVSNGVIINNDLGSDLSGIQTQEGIYTKVLKVLAPTDTQSQRIIVDLESYIGSQLETTGYTRLVYHKLVKYIGEVNGVSNVQEANRSYTEVHAHIPAHTGETPDILFRTLTDVNYKPNLTFPILPNQYQSEIMGAEFFNSPIVNDPLNYPGSYYGQFDTLDFTYKTANGDSIRRTGDYYGVKGDINQYTIDGSTIDGLMVDFNTTHYVKMNIPGRVVTNFDQFNGLKINNEPPKDFEFNAILWYYTVEDNNGNTATNLYGISFLDNPNNNVIEEEVGLRFPTVKKLVASNDQDGTSYSFNLNLNFNIINENTNEAYNPEAINSMFSMNLFNDAMSKLSSTNDSFLNILAQQSDLRDELNSIKGLIYTQTDLNTLNSRINNLEELLRLYSTSQIVSSSTIQVDQIPGTPPSILLSNIDTNYAKIDNIKTSDLYDSQGIITYNLSVPINKNMLINIVNNDGVSLELQGGQKLTLVLDNEIGLNQSIDISIGANSDSSENKKLDIYMISDVGSVDGTPTEILLMGDIDLPVFYNSNTQFPNSAYLWKDFPFKIDFNSDIYLESKDKLKVPIDANLNLISNSIKLGDTLVLNNLFIGTVSVYDFSGQYVVDDVNDNYLTLDISSNLDFVTNWENENFPYIIHTSMSTLLSNMPYFSLNKGLNIKITRVSNSILLEERYNMFITYIK